MQYNDKNERKKIKKTLHVLKETTLYKWSCLHGTTEATCLNSVLPLPLLHVVSVSGQPRGTDYKFHEREPWWVNGAWLSLRRHCGTVFLLFNRDRRRRYILSSDTSVHVWCIDEQNSHSAPPGSVMAFFCDFGAIYKTGRQKHFLRTAYHQKCYNTRPLHFRSSASVWRYSSSTNHFL